MVWTTYTAHVDVYKNYFFFFYILNNINNFIVHFIFLFKGFIHKNNNYLSSINRKCELNSTWPHYYFCNNSHLNNTDYTNNTNIQLNRFITTGCSNWLQRYFLTIIYIFLLCFVRAFEYLTKINHIWKSDIFL